MRWRRGPNLVNLLLLMGIVLLLGGIVNTWWGGDGTPPPPRSIKRAEVPTAPILRDQQPLSAFTVVAGKNLFAQDRKESLPDTAKVEDNLEGSYLLGTMLIGNVKAAIIGENPRKRSKAKPEIEAVYLGAEWHGFKLLEISNDSVTLADKDGRKTLKFPESGILEN